MPFPSSYTDFPNGVTSFGVPVLPELRHVFATHWFVNGNTGSDSNDGRSPQSAMATMEFAFTRISSGDVIHARGNINEQVTTPAGVFDVTILGPSEVTRHPDAHTGNGGYSSCRWNVPSTVTASTPLLKIQQQGWIVKNILFTGSTSDSVDCILLYRDAGSGDAERDASHAWIQGCRFQGGRYGIAQSGGVAHIRIIGNEFMLFSTSGNAAIRTAGLAGDAGVGTGWGWIIDGNDFLANLTDIYGRNLAGPRITNNHFHLIGLGVTNTVAIDITGGSEELVSKNYMYCASDEGSVVNARFIPSTTPSWGPNYYTDKEEYGEPAE